MDANATPFWRRRRTRLFLALALSPVVLFYICTRSFILSPIIASAIQSKLQIEVSIDSADWNWSKGLKLQNIVLSADVGSGPASKVITVNNANVEFVSAFPLFNAEISSVTIDKVIVRLAESLDEAGELNVSHLLHQDSQNEKPLPENISVLPFTVPDISLQELTVEMGTMRSGAWTVESTKNFSVEMKTSNQKQLEFSLLDEVEELEIEVVLLTTEPRVDVTIGNVSLNHHV